MTQALELHLPPWTGSRSETEIDQVFARALAAYECNRDGIEARHPRGTIVAMDGTDPTGRTYTFGHDVLAVEQQHYGCYPETFMESSLFIVGEH